MRWLKSLFSEEGSVSMVRLMAIISLLTGCYLAIIGKDGANLFVTSAFGAKVLSKHLETRLPDQK
jgi:hypothetical protein